jgi:hypothetical protein
MFFDYFLLLRKGLGRSLDEIAVDGDQCLFIPTRKRPCRHTNHSEQAPWREAQNATVQRVFTLGTWSKEVSRFN